MFKKYVVLLSISLLVLTACHPQLSSPSNLSEDIKTFTPTPTDTQEASSDVQLSSDVAYALNQSHQFETLTITDTYWNTSYTITSEDIPGLGKELLTNLHYSLCFISDDTYTSAHNNSIGAKYLLDFTVTDANTFEQKSYQLALTDDYLYNPHTSESYLIDTRILYLFDNFFPAKPYELPGNIETRLHQGYIFSYHNDNSFYPISSPRSWRNSSVATVLCKIKEDYGYQTITSTEEDIFKTFYFFSYGEVGTLTLYDTLVCIKTSDGSYWYKFPFGIEDWINGTVDLGQTPGLLGHLLEGAG